MANSNPHNKSLKDALDAAASQQGKTLSEEELALFQEAAEGLAQVKEQEALAKAVQNVNQRLTQEIRRKNQKKKFQRRQVLPISNSVVVMIILLLLLIMFFVVKWAAKS